MTARSRTAQELIHWLEAGRGSRWILVGALLVCGATLSVLVAWKQFHGAATEATLAQADLGRRLALGEGFSTGINYPQAVAFFRSKGVLFDPLRPYPDVYQAPLYPLVIAASLAALPTRWRNALFGPPPAPRFGYFADYYLLALNVLLFWLAVWLAFGLARRMFGLPSAWLAAIALFVSQPAWIQVASVNGSALLMVLSLAAFHAWWRAESAEDFPGAWLPTASLGALCGALFLAEYSAGALVAVAAWGIWRRFRAGSRWRALGVLAGAFALVSGPWLVRNLEVTGLPVGLAVQNVALKAGDSTAEPAVARATFSATLPHIELNKVANKALISIQDNLCSRVWSSGALWLLAFFAAGWLYAFRSEPVNRLRWLFTAALFALIASQAVFNSGESERPAAAWLSPLIIVFGSGFFFVLLGSHRVLASWPRLCAAGLLALQALPLAHDTLDPNWLHFQYPPYFPQLLRGMRSQLDRVDAGQHFGIMADVPAGLAWYGATRAWAQPATLHDFYEVQLEQPTGELLLTPKTLDRPFFSELNARASTPGLLVSTAPRIGEWGQIYSGLLTGMIPSNFPLTAPQKLADNLYVLVNPSLPATGPDSR